VAEGATSSALVGNIDLAPTFAELAGVPFPDFVDGRPFTAQLDDPATPTDRRSFLLEHWRVELVNPDTTPPGSFTDPVTPVASRPATVDESRSGSAFPESPDPPDFHGLRTDRYTYVEYVTGERELYDNLADPDQLRNLAQIADPALIRALSQRLAELEDCRATACRRAEDLPVPDP
jgi:arylsulfatase A-like enzyme